MNLFTYVNRFFAVQGKAAYWGHKLLYKAAGGSWLLKY